MTATVTVLKDFLPASASRSFHVYCYAGDVLQVQTEHDHGTMCTREGTMCFLLEEEIYWYCRRD